jgi:hypothetical protein
VGWIGFSLVPIAGAVADARDAVQALINGDELGVALNAAGAFSGIEDGVKTGAAVGLFLGKYPEKALDVAKALGKYAFPHAPDMVKLEVLDIIFEGANLLISYSCNLSTFLLDPIFPLSFLFILTYI